MLLIFCSYLELEEQKLQLDIRGYLNTQHLYLNMDKYNDELYVHFKSKDDDDDATLGIA